MKFKTAKLISFLFHPIFFAVLAPFLIINHTSSSIVSGFKWMLFSSFFLFLSLFCYFFLRPVDFLTDFDISNRKKRPLFYATVIFFAVLYFIAAVFFKGIFFPLSIVSLGMILGVVVFEFTSFFTKISVHTAVSSAYVITFGLLYGSTAFLVSFWIPFALAWSRVVLKKHTKKEVIEGIMLGSIVTLITFAIGELLI